MLNRVKIKYERERSIREERASGSGARAYRNEEIPPAAFRASLILTPSAFRAAEMTDVARRTRTEKRFARGTL